MSRDFTFYRQPSVLTALSAVPPQIVHLVRALPPHLADQLSFDDLQKLTAAVGRSGSRHIIDYRLSLPFGSRRFYVRFLCGRERRKLSRLIAEGQNNPWLVLAAATLLFWFMITVSLVIIAVGLYLLKTALGIDVFDGPSFLHRCLFDY